MEKRSKFIKPILWASILFFLGLDIVSAESRGVELNFSNETLSAKITEAPLRDVIATIEKKGVWFKLWLKGKESVLDERVSVRFKGLPIKDGLERIFSPLNHCFVFDQNGKLLGVLLLGKPEPRRHWGKRRRVTPRRTPSRYRR